MSLRDCVRVELGYPVPKKTTPVRSKPPTSASFLDPQVFAVRIDSLATSAKDSLRRMIRVLVFAISIGLALGVAALGATTAVIKGTAQGEAIRGTPGGDIIYGFGGNDAIAGRGGFDVIFGGPGNDTMSGGRGKDFLSGEEGDDVLSAGYVEGRSVDFLSCGAGDDLVIVTDVPEVARDGMRRLLSGAPRDCESVRFAT